MTINISIQDVDNTLHPKITVLGVGGSGGNAVNNMIDANLEGVDFLIANTDAQALHISKCKNKIQLGLKSTSGLGAGMKPEVGKEAAEEAIEDIYKMLEGSNMLFIAAGMGGGTGTGAAPIIAKLAREKGILTVGVVTKPFHFEGSQRMKIADKGIDELQQFVDTLLIIPNQNLFRVANEKTTFADAFKMADDVLYSGVRGVTDLMVQPGMINLDFSDIKTVMSEMGKAMMGTGEASGERRSVLAAEAAIANPLIDDVSLKGAKGLIINISGGKDITLYEVDEAANRIKQEVDENANIIYGTTCDERLEGLVRVSIVATGIDINNSIAKPIENFAPININNDIYKKSIETDEVKINQPLYIDKDDNKNIEKETTDILAETEDSFQSLNENSDHLNYTENTENDDENVSVMAEENNELESENLSNNFEEEKISENESSLNENSEMADESSVRRLSLFDSLSSKNPNLSEENNTSSEKSEPILNSNEEISENNENLEQSHISKNEEVSDNEFNPEESESSDLDDEFNQETEEELLDIPTFLRRQAN